MDVGRLRDSVARYGFAGTGFDLAYRAANRAATAMILRILTLDMDGVDPDFLRGDDPRWGFLAPEELARFAAADPTLGLDAGFLAEAAARGDRCFGFVEDGVLGAYGWYSTRPTPIRPWLTFRFDPAHVYMYKGWTAHAFRGRRLHGIGMARAMRAFVAEGSKGLVSYVEANNHASLKSCARLGYRTVGTVTVVGVRGACLALPSAGCRPYGVSVEVGANRSSRVLAEPA